MDDIWVYILVLNNNFYRGIVIAETEEPAINKVKKVCIGDNEKLDCGRQ